MGIRPRLALVMGVDDLKVDGYKITDPRFVVPPHAPADAVADSGIEWWRCFGYGDDDNEGRIILPEIPENALDGPHSTWQKWLNLTSVKHGLIERDQERKAKRYDDLVFWHSETGPSNVLGVEIGENNTYNDHWLWALCNLMGEEWMRPGYRVIPSLRLEEDRSFDALALRLTHGLVSGVPRLPASIRCNRERHFAARRKAKLLKRGWNVPSFVMEIEVWALFAGYVLRAIGFQHRAADLKLMLVWTWG